MIFRNIFRIKLNIFRGQFRSADVSPWKHQNCEARSPEVVAISKFGAEIGEGDERRRFKKSGDSLNGQNLFSEVSFL